jgi:ribosomal protein S27AE
MPLSIRGPHGYHVEWDPGSDAIAKKTEHDTFTCQHCGNLFIQEKHTIRVKCGRCAGDVGPCCAHKGKCHPVTNPNRYEKLEIEEALGVLRESLGK